MIIFLCFFVLNCPFLFTLHAYPAFLKYALLSVFLPLNMKKVVLNEISFYFAFSYEYQSLLAQIFPCEFDKVFQGHIRIIASAHFLLGISYLRIK